MAGTDTRELQIVLTAKDNATKQLRGLNDQIGVLGTKTGKLRGIFNNFGTSLANTGRSFLSLQGAIAGVGLAVLVADVAKAGANLERMEAVTKVLSKNLGIGADQLKEYRDALAEVNTFGGSATETINTFLQSGLAGTIDFKKFISVTKDFAAAAGVSSKDAIESFTQAVVSLQPELLRSFGIQLNLTQVYKQHAEEIGKVSSELTSTEKRQALLNEVFRQGEAVTGVYSETYKTAGKNLLSIKDAAQNVKEFIGSALTPALREFTGVILTELKGGIKWFEANRDAVDAWAKELAKGAVVAIKHIGTFFKFLIKNKEIIIGLFGAIAISIGVAVAAMLPGLLTAHSAFLILWGVIVLLQKSGIIKWFMGLGKTAKILVGLLAGVPAIGLALAAFIPSVVAGFTALTGVIGTLGVVITGSLLPAIGAVFTALSPILVPLLAIVAVLGLLWLAWQNNFLGIQGIVASFVDWIKSSAFPGLKEFFENVIGGAKALGLAFVGMVEQVKVFLEPFFNWFMEHVWPLMQGFFLLLSDLIKFQIAVWVETFQFWWNIVTSIANWLIGTFQPIVSSVINFITKVIKSQIAVWVAQFKFVEKIIKAVGGFLLETFQPIVEGVMNHVTKAIEGAIKSWVDQFNFVKKVIEGVIGMFQNLINKAREAIQAATEGLGGGERSFQFGGAVPNTGLAYLHKGEFVVSREMRDGRRELPQTVEQNFNQPITIEANVFNETDVDLLGERLAFSLRNSR